MPDRWPYKQVTVVGYVSLLASCFGLTFAIAAGGSIAWAVWASVTAVFVADAIVLTLLRVRLDRSQDEDPDTIPPGA